MRCTERCPECPSRGMSIGAKKLVSGDWNDGPYNILFIGEAPGREENGRGRVFIGKTGEEFNNTYLPLAGLSRSEVCMTNSVKCHWADSSDAPPESLVRSCSEFHLRRELAMHQPDTVVLMGGTANSLLNLDVEMEHGIGRMGSLLGWSGRIFSTFHPALGLHKTDKMLQMIDRLDGDFPRLKRFLRGELPVLSVDDRTPPYERLTKAKHIRSVMETEFKRFPDVAIDTESEKSWAGYPATIRYSTWCATWSIDPDMAYMVRVIDADAFEMFCSLAAKARRILMHNAPHDHERILECGYELPWYKIHDTMQMAYDDGRLPKGLKALAYRLLMRRMRSFDDIVIPHGRTRALEYLDMARSFDWPKPQQMPTGLAALRKCPDCKGTTVLSIGRGKAKKLYPCDCEGGYIMAQKMSRKQSMNEKLNRLFTDLDKGSTIDPWERWINWGTDVDPLICKLGPLPLASIEYVPETQAIEYACGDARETNRISPILTQRLVDLRRSIR